MKYKTEILGGCDFDRGGKMNTENEIYCEIEYSCDDTSGLLNHALGNFRRKKTAEEKARTDRLSQQNLSEDAYLRLGYFHYRGGMLFHSAHKSNFTVHSYTRCNICVACAFGLVTVF